MQRLKLKTILFDKSEVKTNSETNSTVCPRNLVPLT